MNCVASSVSSIDYCMPILDRKSALDYEKRSATSYFPFYIWWFFSEVQLSNNLIWMSNFNNYKRNVICAENSYVLKMMGGGGGGRPPPP